MRFSGSQPERKMAATGLFSVIIVSLQCWFNQSCSKIRVKNASEILKKSSRDQNQSGELRHWYEEWYNVLLREPITYSWNITAAFTCYYPDTVFTIVVWDLAVADPLGSFGVRTWGQEKEEEETQGYAGTGETDKDSGVLREVSFIALFRCP